MRSPYMQPFSACFLSWVARPRLSPVLLASFPASPHSERAGAGAVLPSYGKSENLFPAAPQRLAVGSVLHRSGLASVRPAPRAPLHYQLPSCFSYPRGRLQALSGSSFAGPFCTRCVRLCSTPAQPGERRPAERGLARAHRHRQVGPLPGVVAGSPAPSPEKGSPRPSARCPDMPVSALRPQLSA